VPIVEEAVQKVTAASGRPPILVCHSMGGLVARAWLRSAKDPERVAQVITIGSPHHGTWLGRFSHLPNGRQMRLDSDWLRQMERDEESYPRPPWTCWYSNCDNIVFPVSTAALHGADNRWLVGVAHVALAFAPEVMQSSLAALTASEAELSR
jgi:triacylglycerol esterase/lipase EstA (alpha/beta hydrolase family)